MNIEEPQKTFEQRQEHFESLENKYSKKSSRYSNIRLATFLTLVILVVYFANLGNVEAVVGTTLLLGGIFILLLKQHVKIQYLRDLNHILKNINRDERLRLNLDLKQFDRGEEFTDKNHAYSIDLDLFGRSSLFQLISRAVSSYGRNRIAQLLLRRSSSKIIVDQQTVVKELANDIDWRQEFQASGLVHKTKNIEVGELMQWIENGQTVHRIGMYTWLAIFFRIAFLIGIAAVSFGLMTFHWLAIPLLINIYLLLKFNKTTQNIYDQTGKSFKVLRVYQSLIEKSETAGFSSSRWRELVSEFESGESKASEEIKKLGNILHGFDARNGMMYHLLNPILLLDLHWVLKIEKWKLRNSGHIGPWFEVVGEIEAIASIAAFSYANPTYTFPKIIDKPHHLKAVGLGHPLIKWDKRVTNDFGFTITKQITLVTGSNMSGKSTFLRTVGVNTVLALAGAPVCALEMEVSNMDMFTSMRTQDNLEENISSFYAELTRIRQLLELLGEGKPVMFMLDEILKGTNSKDRHKGAVALTKQLCGKDASGFISTHDLELSYLENQLDQVKNYSFESEIRDGELFFDYKIKKGVTESFNASLLMEKIGIEMVE
jgi:DNA mismatch repair ATPase MutS